MLEAVSLFIAGIFVVGLGVAIATDEEKARWLWISAIGVIFLGFATFGFAPLAFPNGIPAANIDAGEYQVAFVYVAGDNVNVGVEEEFNLFGEGLHLFLYQFSKDAFEGEIRKDATKLVVIESGDFKKLQLK